MFENLSEKLQNSLAKLTKRGKLNEENIDIAMKEVRMALLEADVNFKVAKEFIKNVKEKCIGQQVMESLTPGQMVVNIVNEELTSLMGEKDSKLNIDGKRPSIILMCGLQGAGKTTHSGKLALFLKNKNRNPLLVACDIYRPAAIDQLKIIGNKIDVPVFSMDEGNDPVNIARMSLEKAKKNNNDIIIIDTAGRLHIDDSLMQELKSIKDLVKPDETLLVVDAMIGQDAVNIAEKFNDTIGISGVILSKLDGDARGGAALSIKKVTNTPIKFIGDGEKMEDLQIFHPERMSSRILGMGDVMSLIEKAQQNIDLKKAKELEEKIRSSTFTFNDFLDQLEQMKNLGPLENILSMMPGMNSKMLKNINIDEKELAHTEAIIKSMTKKERENPDIINISRKNRISLGSGCDMVKVNKLLKQFKETKKLMKQFSGFSNKKKKTGMFKLPF